MLNILYQGLQKLQLPFYNSLGQADSSKESKLKTYISRGNSGVSRATIKTFISWSRAQHQEPTVGPST